MEANPIVVQKKDDGTKLLDYLRKQPRTEEDVLLCRRQDIIKRKYTNFDFQEPIQFVDCYFQEVSFDGAIMQKCQFIHCTFNKCTFLNNANLVQTYFFACIFDNVSFQETLLNNAKFTQCICKNTNNFANANLSYASFKNFILTDCIFSGANLHKTVFIAMKLKNLSFQADSSTEAAIVNYVHFYGVQVEGQLYPCTIENVDFQGCDLQYSHFGPLCDIQDDVNFEDAKLSWVHFEGHQNMSEIVHYGNINFNDDMNITLTRCRLHDFHFENWVFKRTTFNHCSFLVENDDNSYCIFEHCLFYGVIFVSCQLQKCQFKPDNEFIRLATAFDECMLQGTNFSGCDLTKVEFINNTFSNDTDFTNALLSEDTTALFNVLEPNVLPRGINDMIPINFDGIDFPELPNLQATRDGNAYEVHREFANLDLNAINMFLTDYINTHDNINPLATDINDKSKQHAKLNLLEFLWPLVYFINNYDEINEAEKLKLVNAINLLNKRMINPNSRNNLIEFMKLMQKAVQFVIRQDNEFIQRYINSFIMDCFGAYDRRGNADIDDYSSTATLSCDKGIYERLIKSIGNAARIENDTDNSEQTQLYRRLQRLFGLTDRFDEIETNRLITTWGQKYFNRQDDDRDAMTPEERQELAEVEALSPQERKEHFINFVYSQLDPHVDKRKIQPIIDKFLNDFEQLNSFETLTLGGRKRTSKTRKPYYKTKSKTE